MNSIYEQMAEKIIAKQETIIGPLAIDRAKSVQGIKIEGEAVKIEGQPLEVIDSLIQMYEQLFGDLSVQVCKEAVGGHIQKLKSDEIPESLR